jgi:hypothetical protein
VVTVIAGAVHSKVGVGGMIDESRIFYNPQRRIVKILGNCTLSAMFISVVSRRFHCRQI